MKYVLLWFVVLCGVVGATIPTHMAPNQVEEIYHQKSNDKSCLEIAYLLLLFSREPQEMSLTPQEQILSNGMHQVTFTFDNTLARQKLLRRMSSCVGDWYMIKFSGYDKTISLVITYDPNKIEVRYDRYANIDLRKGFIIRFFDRTLLNQLKNKESYILQTAAMGVQANSIRLLV